MVEKEKKYMSAEYLVNKKQEFIMPSVKHYYQRPVHLVKGEGQWVYDREGRKYLDCFGGILTVMSGHCLPEINEKIKEQIDTLQHTSTVYLIQPMVELAELLSKITPGELKKTFFVNSGTEAIEGALMLAKIFTGNSDIIALSHSYHGRSYVAQSITGQATWRTGRESLPGITFTPNAYCYRCVFNKSYPNCDLDCAYYLEEVIRTSTSGRLAAIIAEPIQGVGGFVTPPKEYFGILYRIVKEHGGIYISDEVQTGFGRTGKHLFGIEHWDVEPDMITMAKGLGNGMPIGAYITKDEIADSHTGPSICTFGGNHISTVAALANLNLIQKENLAQKSDELGRYFMDGLTGLLKKHDFIGEVRGKGLMIGVEIVKDKKSKAPAPGITDQIMEVSKDNGLLLGRGGLFSNVLRITPPLRIDKKDIDGALSVLDKTFASIEL